MKKLLLLSFALVGFLVSCDSDGSQDSMAESQNELKSIEMKMVEIDLGGFTLGKSNGSAFKGGSDLQNGVAELNEKLADLKDFYRQLARTNDWDKYDEIDISYKNQVVVRNNKNP